MTLCRRREGLSIPAMGRARGNYHCIPQPVKQRCKWYRRTAAIDQARWNDVLAHSRASTCEMSNSAVRLFGSGSSCRPGRFSPGFFHSRGPVTIARSSVTADCYRWELVSLLAEAPPLRGGGRSSQNVPGLRPRSAVAVRICREKADAGSNRLHVPQRHIPSQFRHKAQAVLANAHRSGMETALTGTVARPTVPNPTIPTFTGVFVCSSQPGYGPAIRSSVLPAWPFS